MARDLSVQLYSLREYAEKDFVDVLKFVADTGYKAVEPAGFFGMKPAEFKKIIADLGLKLYSSHTPWMRPESCDASIELAHELGLTRVVCGYCPDDFKDMDAIKRSAEITNKLNEKVTAAGLMLFQHNHDFEFGRIDGKLKYEIYAGLCPGVKFQIDSFWSANFGLEDPVANMKMFSDRVVSVHMKDGILAKNDEAFKMVNGLLERKIDLRPLGEGDLPIGDIIAEIPDRVKDIVVELDSCNIEMKEALRRSYRFMIDNGFAVGNK